MASDNKDEKAGAPAPDAANRAAGGAPGPKPSGDSPKRQGDKMEHAVREAAGSPSKPKP